MRAVLLFFCKSRGYAKMELFLGSVGLIGVSIAVLVYCAVIRSGQISEMERREGKE